MELLKKLRAFLDANHAEYTHTVHPLAYTAREVASAEHLPNREVAKTVVVFADEGYHMIVVPANRLVDFQEVRVTLGFTHARLATEQELAQLFPDCELGAMPPLGTLYGLPVYVDRSLTGDEEIVFEGGTHSEAIRMRYWDFAALVFPVVAEFHRPPLATC